MAWEFEDAWRCTPPSAAFMAESIWALDTARDFRVNAVVYGILEGGTWTPLEQNWRDWFKAQFKLTFVPQIPPEDSYFSLNVPLWTQIYDLLDDGVQPDLELCWLLTFPAAQGGAWPVLWPA